MAPESSSEWFHRRIKKFPKFSFFFLPNGHEIMTIMADKLTRYKIENGT